MSKYIYYIYYFLKYSFLSVFLFFVLKFTIQIFFLDTFVINGDSMFPTIESRDKVVVNKTIFGARIYRSLDFTEKEYFEPFRMKGIRKIAYDDILVFNHSVGKSRPLRFFIDNVLIKRCIGLPGDSISINNGIYINNKIGKINSIQQLSSKELEYYTQKYKRIYPSSPKNIPWNFSNFGPFYIPQKNDTILLTPSNIILYKKLIEYETQGKLKEKEGVLYINGEMVSNYCFKSNYYFVVGDNQTNSIDSRFIGPIPEEFIIGIVSKILHQRK